MSKDLFSNFTFSNAIAMKNRTVLAPMTNSQSFEDGSLSENELRWLSARAEGGFGMIITCAAHVSEEAKSWKGELGVFADRLIPGLKEIPREMRRHGALSIAQIFHGGLRATSKTTGKQPVAPSVVFQKFPDFEVPRALTEPEILKIIQDFKDSAVRAKAAGFDGIEVHGANGYLFTQFMSRVTNERTDRWGGSTENRARILYDVVSEIRKAVPAPFILGVRILAEDGAATKGFDIDEMCEVVEKLSNQYGVDYIHLSSGNLKTISWKYPESGKTNLARLRSSIPNTVALIACGGVKTQADAAAALADGADLIAVGRAAITEPAWPKKAVNASFAPKEFPITEDYAKSVAISPPFVKYLRGMKLIAD